MAVALKRARLFEQVADILEQRIRDRLLPVGAELPSERQMMKEFGVGRPAVREALFHLQRMGLVEFRNGARARVAIPSAEAVMTSLAGSARYVIADADGMRHFQEARVLFETGLVRDVARHATTADIARLRDALATNGEAIGDVRRFEESDMAFHYAIAATPNNPIYAVLHQALIEWLVDQRRVTLSYPGQNRVAYDAHAAIFEAIAARDPGEADARMRSHLAQVSDLYWKVRGARQ